jgi:nitroreductase
MELMEAIRGRRAVRSYTGVALASETLKRLVDAAIQAPSAINAQPWHFTVIRNQASLDRISHAAKSHMLRSIAADGPMREHLEDPHFHIFYHAPALILISARDVDWASEDAALAAENLMLAACGEGLGSCWIGFAQRWLETDEGKRTVSLPEGYIPVAPIIVGVARETTPPVPRKPAAIQWLD